MEHSSASGVYILPLLVAPGWKTMFIPECRLYSESAAALSPRPSPKRSSRTQFYQAPVGLPRRFHGRESTCQCGRHGFSPWVRKIPWRRRWPPTPVFLPGKSHGQRILEGYSPWGCKESDTTRHLGTHMENPPCSSTISCCGGLLQQS